MQLVAWEVISTVELEPFVLGNGDSLTFRIEVQKRIDNDAPTYRARVFRTELFQMRPSFPDGSRESTDAVLLADDSYTPSTQQTYSSGPDAMAAVFADLDRAFGDVAASQLS